MGRPWNFSAGPAVLPEAVLRQVQSEALDWRGSGMSVMEMSHRGKEFTTIIGEAEADLRDLLGLPPEYRLLFLQGGATQQFAQIPMNLLAGRSADYVVTGSWSKKAFSEAQRIAPVRCAASTESAGFASLPTAIDVDPRAAYVHLCTNETIHGVEVFDVDALLGASPAGVPVVADMSSHLLSRPIDISRFGLIYGGAQKNVGPSGLTLVIVREDLLGQAPASIPSIMDYAVMAEHGSMLNTPPTFGIYVAGLVFKWLREQGGLAAIERVNEEKARLLYELIDASEGFYVNPVAPACRSRMNLPFRLARAGLDEAFVAESRAAGLLSLKGHKSFGGMRASIYNAMPLAGVRALAEFMNDFRRRHG